MPTMKLSEVKVGDKFFLKNKMHTMYLRIDMSPSERFSSALLIPTLVCALDLTTFKVVGIQQDFDVVVESNNGYI